MDNWFAIYIDGAKLMEDSIPYQTERSFNAERITFSTDLPVTIAFELRDYMENNSGLEYIGTRKQQMGDGGAIFQFRDQTGHLLGASAAGWRCKVVQHAPANPSCANERNPVAGVGACMAEAEVSPANWAAPGFNDASWQDTRVYSAREVGPKDGYDMISWDRSAELIWGPSLKQDNIVLCRGVLQ
ncbi:PEBP family protein [Pseudoruegeria sp. HB172150]|uniref:PEBP family protein n=1 Tax=Pseudoruegeria sp. HB172150 TaxID=2721164 RepID=UPI001553D0D8|nr:PEBP family protein [Pseudoruegeria sp. HB172150]